MNLAFYTLVYTYINDKINTFGTTLMGNLMGVVSGVALTLVTLWIMIQGFRIATGQSQENLMVFVTKGARIALIVTAATTMNIFGSNLHDLFTTELPTDINQLFTGNDETIQSTIDKNLAATVLAMTAIDAVQAPVNDTQTVADKGRAADFAMVGTATPPMAAGAMLLMFNLAIALFVGLGPLFILCLIFEQTKGLFQRWLMYGIGTVFAMAMLSFVSSIVLNVTVNLATSLWATNFINQFTGGSSEGLTTQSMEQGGIGLLMTMLIISAPPMAASFFQGTLGSFLPYSSFGGRPSAQPGAHGQPPGSFNYGTPPSGNAGGSSKATDGGGYGSSGGSSAPSTYSGADPTHSNRYSGVTAGAPGEAIRQGTGLASPPPSGLPPTPPSSYTA